MPIRRWIDDTIAWTYGSKGEFSVSSFRKRLENCSPNDQTGSVFQLKGWCPPKVEIFAWQLRKRSVLVREVLCSFGMGQGLSKECLLCLSGSETIYHLFIHCPWSWQLWCTGMSWWEVLSCPNNTLKDWMDGWSGLSPSPRCAKAWCMLFFAVGWTIWEFRNNFIFKRQKSILEQAAYMVKFRVVWWFKFYGSGAQHSVSNMMLNVKESCISIAIPRKLSPGVWIPHVGEKLKFNVDGSARGKPGPAGYGNSQSLCALRRESSPYCP
ncbi:hypothetical protein Dsin_004466 [Dipteronia sinensis]|uniref:Reverse transcriptase zinc-binding domain-containing protein n=1 Tax=Dipteronia sinensis TaxID=43782 RepID=A0AAE0EDZ8_9ROSI|nr:hypothetical protein Dsin_004466 [Dipteronia sinensis]